MYDHVPRGQCGANGTSAVPVVVMDSAPKHVSARDTASVRAKQHQLNNAIMVHVLHGAPGATGLPVQPVAEAAIVFGHDHAMETVSVQMDMPNKKAGVHWPIAQSTANGANGASAADHAPPSTMNQLKRDNGSVLSKINVVRLIWLRSDLAPMFLLVQLGPSGVNGLPVVYLAQVATATEVDTVRMDQTVLEIAVNSASVPRPHVHHGHHGWNGVVAVSHAVMATVLVVAFASMETTALVMVLTLARAPCPHVPPGPSGIRGQHVQSAAVAA